MLDVNSYLPLLTLFTNFAQTYAEGTYGADAYNDQTTATPSQSPSTSSPSTSTPGTPTNNSTSVAPTPVAATAQPDTPQVTWHAGSQVNGTTAPDTVTTTAVDPTWLIIAGAIILIVLFALITLIIKRLTRSNRTF